MPAGLCLYLNIGLFHFLSRSSEAPLNSLILFYFSIESEIADTTKYITSYLLKFVQLFVLLTPGNSGVQNVLNPNVTANSFQLIRILQDWRHHLQRVLGAAEGSSGEM